MSNIQSNPGRGGFFYFLMCCAAFLIILLPVGIANLYFGYVLQDSPCTLCWGQRIAMIYIGVAAYFIVRYGFRPRYISAILIFAGFGMWQSLRHLSMHSGRDLDQGFGLMVYGLHTYSWAEVVFWAVIIILGVMFFFAPSELGPASEEGKPWRRLNFLEGIMMGISALIIASNLFQAAVSTGLPPNYGQGDPVRFSLNPKEIIHTGDGMKGHYNKIDFLGKRNVQAPDYAFMPNAANLGIEFDHKSANAPVNVDQQLTIVSEEKIDIGAQLNTLNLINGEYVVSSKFHVYYLNPDLKIVDQFEFDPLYSATIDPIVGIIPYNGSKYLLMGSNKSFMKYEKSKTDKPEEQIVGRYSDFVAGGDHFLSNGRGRVQTVRAQYHHIMSSANDDVYNYVATVPNNNDKKSFVISKQLLKDMVTSGEFSPKAALKEKRSLGELYVTGMAVYEGNLYCLSKNFNVILQIDPKTEQVVKVFGLPENLTDPRGLIVLGNGFQLLDNNNLVTLK